MAASSSRASLALLLCALMVALAGGASAGSPLSSTFYDASCPSAHDVVRRVIQNARVTDPRIPASLIRLHFHDCFVQTEKTVPANNNSARGFPVVDAIKSALEAACPGIVSCADILALAAEISVEISGGPSWRVLLGRRDGTTTNVQSAKNLPSPFDSLGKLQQKFRNVNLDNTDLVALQGYCQFTRENCTAGQPAGSLENLDRVTPNVFDNKYYGTLLHGQAQLPSDQVMLSDPAAPATTAPIVNRFASNQKDFFGNFVTSMIKMGNISPLTGRDGEIRKNCRRVNSKGY
nr:unnamed protein product [Digitaria exilis]